MKVLLLLEHTFLIDEQNRIWSETVVDYKYLSRYLGVFERVILCARAKKVRNDDPLLKKYNLLASGDGIEIAPLPFAVSSKEIILNYLKTRKKIKEAIKSADCAIIRGPSILSLSVYKLFINRTNFAVEFVMGANEILSNKNIIRRLVNIYLDYSAKKMCLKANGVSYVTKKLLQDKYPSYSIKNKIDSDKYFDSSYSTLDLYKENFYEKKWNKNNIPNEFIISHIGSMQTDRKGQSRLLDIAKIIIDKGYNIKVLFIGDGKNKEKLIEKAKLLGISDKTEFMGNINNRNLIFEILQKSHFFVLPTSSEGLPRSIIEAMATSTPCIASNVDGIPELLEKEDLIRYDDIYGFARRIEYLINDWNEMIEISKRNYLKAQDFEYEAIQKKRNEFYQKLKQISN